MTIAEYGTQMEGIGFTTAEIQSIFEKGIETKTWNIDNLNDGVKEARITMSEFGLEVDDTTATLLKGTGKSAADFQAWGKAVASGGEQGSKAMGEVSEWLKTIEDDSLRNELAIKVFGTKAEDQLDNMIAVFGGLSDAQDKSVQNLEGFNNLVDGINSDPMVKMKEAMNNMMVSLAPLLTGIAEFVGKIAEWAAENPGLTATFAAIGTVVGILVGAFAALMPAISALVSLWPVLAGAIGAISAPVAIAVAAVVGLVAAAIALWKNWDSVSAWLSQTWETIKSNAVSAFTQISQGISNTWNEVKSAISSVWNGIKSFLNTVWNGIKTVAVAIFNGIKSYYTTVFNVYKTIIVGTWNVIKSTLSAIWNGLKTLASTVFNGIKTVITTVFNGIKSTVTSVWNTVKSNTTSAFNNIKAIITTVISTVKGVITAGLQLITGNWKGAFNTLKSTASNMVSSITGIFKGTNLFTIGKQIISGLIRGISNMKNAALEAIAGVANGVIKKAKSLLRIASPSKEFHEIGEFTGIGWANGISATKKLVEKAVSNVAKVTTNAAKKNAATVTAIEKAAEKERKAVRKEYAEKRKSIKKGDNKALAKIEKQLQAELKKINDKAAKDILAKEKQLNSEKLVAVESYIKKKKDANELSLFQEAQYYRAAAQQLKKGSAEQISAQTSYKNLVNTINNEIVSINNDYLKRTQDINNNLIKGEEELNKKYEDAYKARYQTILGYYGLFDEVKEREAVSGSEIIGNLQDQITELNLWRNQLGRLEAKGLSETMLEDLRGMGPSILSQLDALNKMTDEELSKYQRLYEEKMTFASVTATKELKPLQQSTQDEIIALRKTANEELNELNTEWQKAIYKVVQGTDETFSTLQQVGKNAAQNLIDGLSGMENSLLNKAREIATNVSNAINSALNISGNANLGASITASLNTASASLASSAAKTQSTGTQTTSNKISGLKPLVAAIVKLANRPVETSVNLDGKTVANVVSGHQYNNTAISALTKGVSLK